MFSRRRERERERELIRLIIRIRERERERANKIDHKDQYHDSRINYNLKSEI